MEPKEGRDSIYRRRHDDDSLSVHEELQEMNKRLGALEGRINFLFGALGVIVVIANVGIALVLSTLLPHVGGL